jgi:hypothetical protein
MVTPNALSPTVVRRGSLPAANRPKRLAPTDGTVGMASLAQHYGPNASVLSRRQQTDDVWLDASGSLTNRSRIT